MKISRITILSVLILFIMPSAVLHSHYFPVAEVNHVLEIKVSLDKISIQYVIWVPGGKDSVILEKLNTYVDKGAASDSWIEEFAGGAIKHYEEMLNVFLNQERIRFEPVSEPANFGSWGMIFNYEHKFENIMKGRHKLLIIDNNDTEVAESSEEMLVLGNENVKIGRQKKTTRRLQTKIKFKPGRKYIKEFKKRNPPESTKKTEGQ